MNRETRQGPFGTSINMSVMAVVLRPGAHFQLTIPAERNIFFYVVRGRVEVNDEASTILPPSSARRRIG